MSVVTQQARDWAASGAMALTGRPDGPPLVAPDGLVDRIRALGAPLGLDPLSLLGERAASAGLRRGGPVSCGGSAHLLRARDGWVAVSLARDSDVEAIPAWLGHDGVNPEDPWPAVAATIAAASTETVVAQGVLLGLPVAAVPLHPPAASADTAPVRASRVDELDEPTYMSWNGTTAPAGDAGDRAEPTTGGLGSGGVPQPRPTVDVAEPSGVLRLSTAERFLVVDLSSLWAGPLCARLLGERGARVVKVESLARPDGARSGPAAFFDVMHHGHDMVALDLTETPGVEHLRRLLGAADVVIESSRPRALEQLGIDAVELLRSGPKVWVSITGHGREGPGRNRVAFGDDAAAGGGLVARDTAGPCFVADAVADPLTGVAAASAVVQALEAGGRWLLDVAMTQVAAHVAAGAAPDETWTAGNPEDAGPPRAPNAVGPAAPLGHHTDAVLAGL